MEVKVEWSPKDGIATVTHSDVSVDSEVSYLAWKNQLLAQLAQLQAHLGYKFPAVICVDGLVVSSDYQERYGNELAPQAAQYVTAVARYGGSAEMRNAVVQQSALRSLKKTSPVALKREHASNLYPSRDAAVQFLLRLSNAA